MTAHDDLRDEYVILKTSNMNELEERLNAALADGYEIAHVVADVAGTWLWFGTQVIVILRSKHR